MFVSHTNLMNLHPYSGCESAGAETHTQNSFEKNIYFIARGARARQRAIPNFADRIACFEFNPMMYSGFVYKCCALVLIGWRARASFPHKLHKFIKWKGPGRQRWLTRRPSSAAQTTYSISKTHSIYPIFMRQTLIPCATAASTGGAKRSWREMGRGARQQSHAPLSKRNRNIYVRTTNELR